MEVVTGMTVEVALDESGSWADSGMVGFLINPFNAIDVDQDLARPHLLIIPEDVWVATNVKLIGELGPEIYLRNLLSILKGNYVEAPGAADHCEDAADDDLEYVDEGEQHASIPVDVMDDYIGTAVCERLATEPNILARSVNAFHAAAKIDELLLEEISDYELDSDILFEALSMTPEDWRTASFEARRLLIGYFFEVIYVNRPGSPLGEQVRMVWRVPISSAAVPAGWGV